MSRSKDSKVDLKVWHLADSKTGKPCDFMGKKTSLRLFDLSTNVSKIIVYLNINLN